MAFPWASKPKEETKHEPVRPGTMREVVNQRVETIKNMILDGYSRYKILEYTGKKWNIKRAMTDHYIARAQLRIAEEAKESDPEYFNKTKQRYERLFKKNIKEGKLPEARRVLTDLNKVLGYEKIIQEVRFKDETNNNEHLDLTGKSEEEIKQILKDRLAELRK